MFFLRVGSGRKPLPLLAQSPRLVTHSYDSFCEQPQTKVSIRLFKLLGALEGLLKGTS